MAQSVQVESSKKEESQEERPVLVYIMTDFEQGAILPALRGFGEQLAASLADQLARHVPGVDRQALVCGGDEIMGRALAFIANLNPEEFGRRIAGSQLKIQVVPHLVPCPTCARHRVATMNRAPCKSCGGSKRIAMLIAPENRIVSEEQITKPKLSLVDASGRDIPS